LLKYGLIPEFIGRLPVVASLDELSEKDLVRVLSEPRNALTKQYACLFGFEDVELEFTEKALSLIAGQAVKKKSGARGLRAILENIMLPVMYELPNNHEMVEKVIINEEVVAKGGEPTIIYKAKKKTMPKAESA